MALQSPLFSGDPKLEAAAVSNPAHIVPGARGPHVAKIQKALNQLINAGLKEDGVYGPRTAAAVEKFKRTQTPPILNFAGKIDNIVGLKTMAALDEAMRPQRGGGLSLNFAIEITPVDIVVNFKGAPSARLLDPKDALPESMLLATHDPVPNDPLNRQLFRHKQNGALLFRLAHATTEVGAAGLGVLAGVLVRITNLLLGTDPSNGNLLTAGKIFILGTSSGGRAAVTFAGMLIASGFRPHFVAAIDATFSQADTTDRPIIAHDPVAPIPSFTVAAAAGALAGGILTIPHRHNFFQHQGNHAKRVLNPLSPDLFNFLYTSNMAGGLEEIHGSIEGFTSHLLRVSGASDDDFHDICDPEGRFQAQNLIVSLLR